MTLIVGKLRFSSVSHFERYFKAIRSRYALRATISGKDVDDLYNLLEFHAGKGAPRRGEVARFAVDSSKWNHPCFYAIKTNGSRYALGTSRSSLFMPSSPMKLRPSPRSDCLQGTRPRSRKDDLHASSFAITATGQCQLRKLRWIITRSHSTLS
jgi:hypothetical protein